MLYHAVNNKLEEQDSLNKLIKKHFDWLYSRYKSLITTELTGIKFSIRRPIIMSNYNNNKPFESIMDKLQKKTPKVPPKPTLKDKAVRKPNAVPPKTRYIKMQDGGMAIKKRPEDMQERLERLIHKFEDGPKPKHYDDKSIVDQEEWNNMTPLQKKTPIIQRPRSLIITTHPLTL